MNRPRKQTVRFALLAVIVLATLLLGYAYVTGTGGTPAALAESRYESQDGTPVVAPGGGVTVVATDSNSVLGRETENPRSKSELVAFERNGSVLYYNDSHTRYWDVDPVPGTERTVEYVFADHLDASTCETGWNHSEYAINESLWETYAEPREGEACTRNGIERVNLDTGETTRLFAQRTPGKHSTRWHDADRINDTHRVVADIYLDRVCIVDTRTEKISWQWRANRSFSTASGGPYPKDWTHLNDVEVLPDGRLMADLRNQDQVVFLDPTQNKSNVLQEDWTLGSDDTHSTLFEQHNPDYIPASRGGPAVVVAGSENNRVLEYQRANGSWKRTWSWTDGQMQWPRDADRLANGHTLIADSNGDRVLEVDESGAIVWQSPIAFPYEVERLSTGGESVGGPSAQRAGLDSSDHGGLEGVWLDLRGVINGPTFSGIQWLLPVWMGIFDLVVLVVGLLAGISWAGVELWWRAPFSRELLPGRPWG